MAGQAYQAPAIQSAYQGTALGNGYTLAGGVAYPTSQFNAVANPSAVQPKARGGNQMLMDAPPNTAPGNASGSPYQIPSIYAGMPAGPGYTDDMSGVTSLGGQAKSLLGGVNVNQSGIDAFSKEALRTGPSQWAQDATKQQNYLSMQAKDQGAATTQGATASARAQLAARGGLSGGAAERLAQGGANNYLNMTQGVNNTETNNDMQIGMNDEQNRLSALGQLPGMQMADANFGLQKATTQLGADSQDNQNQFNANANLNQWNLGMYGQTMGGWAAQQNAEANRNTGKSL